MNDTAPRDRDTTETSLIQAVEAVILDEGFAGVGINALARRAGVDKVLIYRYFGGLSGLLTAYAEAGDFWWRVDDLLAEPLPDPDSSDALAQTLARVFERHVAFLRRHPVTLEVIAWEMSARNELTAALESVREQRSLAVMRCLAERFGVAESEFLAQVAPLLTLLGAAANYLAARGRHLSVFNGLDLQSEAGWTQLCRTAEHMLAAVQLPHPSADSISPATNLDQDP
ncbi:TetR/AcrR family transcriptional regulator [Fodinicurvata halophila]|uniref:TetR/AcrR family transcriptional regulator n=1 Tax=Fodinicurvata halophila TaxID=1419723 RepID=A0ABV8UPJ9_9PROT